MYRYACVTPMRLLLEGEKKPDLYKDRISGLMDHVEERMTKVIRSGTHADVLRANLRKFNSK